MLNKVILIGNVGKDPVIRNLEKNKVASFSLATTKSYKDKSGERKDITQWHNITLWDNLAELAEKYVSKGSKLYIEGELVYEDYENEGKKITVAKIIAREMKFLSSPKQDTSNESQAKQEYYEPAPEKEDDLPF